MNIKKVISTYIMLAVMLSLPLANIFAIGSSGASAFVFLNNGFGARATGMGKAFVAVADDVTSIYWNPAGLTAIKQREAIAMHSSLFSNLVFYDALGYSQYFDGIGNVGFGFVTLNVPGIKHYDNSGEPGDNFIDSENALFLSYAYKYNKLLSVGGSLKTIFHKIYKYSAVGFALDAGATYKFIYDLKFGAAIENFLSTGLKFNAPGASRSYAYPKIRIGASYTGLRETLLSIGIDQQMKGPFNYYLGAEYDIFQYFDFDFKVRGGFDNERITGGLGITYQQYIFDYSYAYSLSNNFLGNSHRISVSAKF